VRGVNTSSGKVVSQLRAHTGPATSISIDPSGLYAASGGSDGRVCVWDLRQQVCWFNLHPTVLPLRASPVVVDTFCCLSCRPPCPPPPARILVTCNPFFFSLPFRSHHHAPLRQSLVYESRVHGTYFGDAGVLVAHHPTRPFLASAGADSVISLLVQSL
jgi:WD40 repeat protein